MAVSNAEIAKVMILNALEYPGGPVDYSAILGLRNGVSPFLTTAEVDLALAEMQTRGVIRPLDPFAPLVERVYVVAVCH